MVRTMNHTNCRQKINYIYFCSFFIIFIACFFPKISGLNDNFIKPKWFLTETSGCILLFIYILYYIIKGFKEEYHLHSVQDELCKSAVSISFIEVLYVVSNILSTGNIKHITGTFDNPTGLSICLCTLLPFHYYLFDLYKSHKPKLYFIIISLISSITIIILTNSRTGWIYIALNLLYFIKKCIPQKKKIIIIISSLITTALIYLILNIKSSSTLGRIFILERSWELIKENPLSGWGYGGFVQNYMLKQAEFFKSNLNSQYAWLADDIKHPLNEFLLSWINFGILGFILHLSIFILLFIRLNYRKNSYSITLKLSLLSIAIFSLFSYPMIYPLSWIILILCLLTAFNNEIKNIYKKLPYKRIFLAFCLGGILIRLTFLFHSFELEKEWYNIYYNSLKGKSKEMMPYYDSLYRELKSNRYFLYNYASEQFYAERYDSALITAKECLLKWPTYNLSLLMGDICRNSEKYEESIGYYEQAFYMCPVRFAPLEGLYYSYRNSGMQIKADSIAEIIKHKEIKIYSNEIKRIKQEIINNQNLNN